jgi:enediyne biosynthesis protein E4
VENLTGSPQILSSKPNPSNHWISVELEGAPRNRLALNARVHVTANGQTQLGEVRSGGSYLSQNDLRLHFGLGTAKTVDMLEVSWPGGATQTFHSVAGDRFYKLKQGGDLNPVTFAAKK